MAECGTEVQQPGEAAPIAVRIFVGGLGERASDDDLQQIFSTRGLGKVETVEIIRTKGRSFAYIDFFPSSDNSLSKLFSTYNGCAWKGGKLRLEKAKEDYLARMKKEWAEDDAQLAALSSSAEKKEEPPLPTKEDFHDQKMSFFFPRLGKVKSIPLTGSGKHRYSFRRVEVPPLPTYFCDCEEHGGNVEPVKRKQNPDLGERDDGLNEQEINLMNSVMNKLLQRESVRNPGSGGRLGIETAKDEDNLKEAAMESDGPVDEVDDQQVDDDSGEDEDNIIINIVGRKPKPLLGSQDAKLESRQDSNVSGSGNELKQHSTDSAYPKKERKSSVRNGESHMNESSSRSCLKELDIPAGAPSIEKGKGVKQSIRSVSGKRKSSWKELVGKGSSSTFSISEVLTGVGSSKKKARKSDRLSKSNLVEKNPSGDEKIEGQLDEAELVANGSSKQFSISEVLTGSASSNKEVMSTNEQGEGKLSETEPVGNGSSSAFSIFEVLTRTGFNEEETKSGDMNEVSPGNDKELSSDEKSQLSEKASTSDKSGRGSAWLHKSSWTQLVSGDNSSLFRISEILPGAGKQEPSVADAVKPASSTGDQHDDKLELVQTHEPVKDLVGRKERDVEVPAEISQKNVASNNEGSVSTAEKEPTLAAKKLVIGETCSFMRSAASLKEWQKAKAAVKGSGKRKRQ